MLVKLVQVLGRCFLPLRLDILYEELCGYAWRGDKNYPIYILSKYMNEKLAKNFTFSIWYAWYLFVMMIIHMFPPKFRCDESIW